MPKKPPRNAFYFFMVDFKEDQRKNGINYQNMAAVAEAAGPLWKNAAEPVRAKYEAIAKKEKAKNNLPENKYTSYGVSYEELQAKEREEREADERERKDITNMVKLKQFNDKAKYEDFFIMDVNTYCKTGSLYVVCEFTITRFSLVEGIRDEYHEMVNPECIPVGYASDAKLSCEELGLEMPDPDAEPSNYMLILANLMDYLRAGNSSGQRSMLPAIFTLPDKVAPVLNFIQQLCQKSNQDDAMFRIYRLDLLFYTLINAIKSRSDEGFPKESLALLQLKKDSFRYNQGLGCQHHLSSAEKLDKVVECTMSRVKRWAFTILDHCCPIAGIELQAGTHVPGDFDLQTILTYKEQKQQRAGPSVGRYAASCNSSVVSDSLNEVNAWPALGSNRSNVGATASQNTPQRTHKPLRMPKVEFSKDMQKAPDLTENDFPKLVGAGRGRRLATSLNQLKLNK